MSTETNNEYSFIWKIDNFSMSPQKNGEGLRSPQFTTENVGDSKWVLILYPEGLSEETVKYISLFLNRSKKEFRKDVNNIDVKIEAMSPNGDTFESIESKNLLFKRGDTWGWKRFFKTNKLFQILEYWKEDVLTIRCTIFNRNREKCEGRTKIEVNHYSFKWKLKIPDDLVQSNYKEFILFDESQLKIRLSAVEGDVKLSISGEDKEVSLPIKLSCTVSLLGIDGSKIISKKDTHCFGLENANIWEFPTFISIHQLELNRDGTFTLLFEFSSANGNISSVVLSPTCQIFPEINNAINLRENLRDMFKNEIHPDIVIYVENEKFSTHKSILSARSPVFSTMFDQDMIENRTGIVNVSDVEAMIFKSFLEYVYTGTIDEMDYESASKLLVVADRYEVLSLKSKCADVLMSVLSEENVCEVLTLADMVNSIDLRVFSLDFIAEHAKEILTSSRWVGWSVKNIKLASEVLSNIKINFEKGPRKEMR